MQQLTGLDEMFLALDTGSTTGHAAALAFFDSEEPRDEVAFLRERVRERLPSLDLFRWKLRQVPLHLDQRYWVETSDIDLNYHVTGVKLKAPGGKDELRECVDGIMRELLARDRPMWRIFVIEGLENGGYCYLLKLTHGLADGSVIWQVFKILSDDPAEPLVEAVETPPAPPSWLGMLGKGVKGLASKPLAVARLEAELTTWARQKGGKEPRPVVTTMARVLPGELGKPIAALANKLRPGDAPEVAPLIPTLRPPKSPFNGNSTANVTFDYLPLPVSELRKAGKVVGGTVNDAVLTITAATLRRYMEEHGGAPSRPLIAAAPISWRTGAEKERWSNQIWMLYMPIPTHLSDPMDRLRFVRAAANQAKRDWDGVPGHLLRKASALVPGVIISPAAKLQTMIPGNPQIYNLSVSNVRGPSDSPTYGGRKMGDYIVYGFLPTGTGLLVAGQSIGDQIIITFTVCKDLVTEYQKLPGMMRESLDELLALADGQGASTSS